MLGVGSMNAAKIIPGMRKIDHIHFIGIGGAGMCGIAEVLSNQGYKVSGSDLKPSANTDRLIDLGVIINFSHAEEHVHEADVVVVSSAIDLHNPEITYAKQNRIPVVARAEMLAELMRYRHGIAVAGTHGKTTTTSMIASIFSEAGLDPTFIIGGMVNNFGTHARLGESRYLVVEADESDASFLHLQPMAAVITNVEADHMATYDGSMDKLKQTFYRFTNNLPFYGAVVVCIDDPVLKTMVSDLSRSVITYGFDSLADVQVTEVEQIGLTTQFIVKIEQQSFTLKINQPGIHNVLNATAAVALSLDEGIDIETIEKGLLRFQGVGRRFEVYGDYPLSGGQVTLVDDYGHHPSELAVTIDALRASYPNRRVVMIFQPHRFSRTRDLYDDFVSVLAGVDILILLDVYAAGEAPIAGADSRSLAHSLRVREEIEPIVVKKWNDVPSFLKKVVKAGDVVITQGAGNVNQLASLISQVGFE